MDNAQLASLVEEYQKEHAPRLDNHLKFFQELPSLEEAIRFACGPHPHRRHFDATTLENARKRLMQNPEKLREFRVFARLRDYIEGETKYIGFGDLTVYDTSLWLGAYLNRWPKVVYLHAGVRIGCDALGLTTDAHMIEMDQLPRPIQVLKPHHAENFLCIYNDCFHGGSTKRRFC
ncbi:MAG TPA: hypothetical protein VGM05_13565 [Planctomycetaceae bacterium]|jgi:hypothetical protein